MADAFFTTPTTAVILAAGLGSRLQTVFATAPKGLLPLAGKSLMARSLDRLQAAGMRRVIVVIGYRADDYRRFFAEHLPDAELIENPHFARSGSMHSLYLARERVPDDFLLLESDLLYEQRALNDLLVGRARDCLLLSGPTGQGDEVYAYVAPAENRLCLLAKNPPASAGASAGEFVGITRMSRELLSAMCGHYEAHGPLPNSMHYDDCLSDLSRVWPIQCHKIDDLLWGEVDDPQHLERVQMRLLPTMENSRDAACSAQPGLFSSPPPP